MEGLQIVIKGLVYEVKNGELRLLTPSSPPQKGEN